MDGISTQPAAAIAGALGTQATASQDRLRRQREARMRDIAGATEAEPDASDSPVEQPAAADAIPSNLPPHVDARPEKDRPRIDVTA